ncbi:heme-binding protein [Streptomyces sp. NPDC058683]|uniref:GlcG/HbpS family heme-binding protein n=1 Tax=Streptomyces sp. NPDC058683 TaxID=3346597 RepID=UPI00365D8813
MNRTYLTALAVVATAGAAIALVPTLASASAPNAAPASSSRSSSTALGTTHFLTLAAAEKASDAALNSCRAKGYPVSVTVVDRDGITITQQRADTATGATVQVSLGKAVASAGFQIPTSTLQEAAKTNPGAVSIPGFNILPGGLPISLDGSVVAGIGVSGAPSGDIDASCATDGIKAIS